MGLLVYLQRGSRGGQMREREGETRMHSALKLRAAHNATGAMHAWRPSGGPFPHQRSMMVESYR